MKQLILNADDFGRHPLINQAVADAVDKGCLRSASLMTGEAYFAEAVAVARQRPQLGVGVHLTLVDGRPVLPAEDIPSLVTQEGSFLPDHGSFVKKFLSGKIASQEIRKELTAQLTKALKAGIKPTHVDSHQHLHMLPGIFSQVLELAETHGIKRVRISRGIHGNPFTPWPGLGDLVGKFGLEILAVINRHQAANRGFSCPGDFVGQVAGGAVTKAFMLELADSFSSGVVEIMLHPGIDNEVLSSFSGWQHDYEAEFQALCDSTVQQKFSAQGIRLINFDDL